MGVINRTIKTFSRRAEAKDIQAALLGLGSDSSSGVEITQDNCLGVNAFYACVKVIVEDVAKIPTIVYERLDGGGKQRAVDHDLYRLLHLQPNCWQTPFEFKEMMTGHVLCRGNAFARKIMKGRTGRIEQLIPLHPGRMQVIQLADDQPPGYLYTLKTGQQVPFTAVEIFHLRGFAREGSVGLDLVDLAANSIGLTQALEDFGARFFRNDARPGGLLTHPGALGDEAQKRLKRSWDEIYAGGPHNKHRVAVLEEGMKWETVGVEPDHAQFLDSRKYQLREICRWFRMPPHKVGDLDDEGKSNLEQEALNYVDACLSPWLVRWEQKCNLSLLDPRDQAVYFTEFLLDSLLRGDTLSRYQAYHYARLDGWMNGDEIRGRENMNPIADGSGEKYWTPANVVTDVQQDPAGPALPAAPAPPAAGKSKASQLIGLLARDTAGRVIRRERQDVTRLIERSVPEQHRAALLAGLEKFWADHAGYLQSQMTAGAEARMIEEEGR